MKKRFIRYLKIKRERLRSIFFFLASDKISFKKKHAASLMPPRKTDDRNITAILNLYARPHYLKQQVEALRRQSVPPKEIWIWGNCAGGHDLTDFSDLVDRVVISNYNWKFYGRFCLAQMAATQYVAFFDDDMLPGKCWFENCLNTIESGCDGILGGSGVRLSPQDIGCQNSIRAGWHGPYLDKPQEVDLVGHAWFLNKDYLKYLFYEEPFTYDNGEDLQLSYMALKHGGVKTYVPPHPESNPDLWSTSAQVSGVWGNDDKAHFKTIQNHYSIRDEIVEFYKKQGWQSVGARQGMDWNK